MKTIKESGVGKTPKMKSQFFENHNLYNIVNECITSCECHKREVYMSDDTKNFVNYINNKLILINQIICKEPRFDYTVMQNDIDLLYKKDKQICGVEILLFFDENNTDKSKLGYLTYHIK